MCTEKEINDVKDVVYNISVEILDFYDNRKRQIKIKPLFDEVIAENSRKEVSARVGRDVRYDAYPLVKIGRWRPYFTALEIYKRIIKNDPTATITLDEVAKELSKNFCKLSSEFFIVITVPVPVIDNGKVGVVKGYCPIPA